MDGSLVRPQFVSAFYSLTIEADDAAWAWPVKKDGHLWKSAGARAQTMKHNKTAIQAKEEVMITAKSCSFFSGQRKFTDPSEENASCLLQAILLKTVPMSLQPAFGDIPQEIQSSGARSYLFEAEAIS